MDSFRQKQENSQDAKLMPRLFVLFLAACCLSLTPKASSAESTSGPSLITATDLFKLKQLKSPVLSPDGKWVVYVVRSVDRIGETAHERGQLWIAAVDGKTPPEPLIESTSDDSLPCWSPQDDRLAFVRATDTGSPQVFLVGLTDRTPVQLTTFDLGAGEPQWSPDGSKILVSSPLSLEQWQQASKRRRAKETVVPVDGKTLEKVSTAVAEKKADRPAPALTATEANPEGSPEEIRAWLDRNEARGNPSVMSASDEGGDFRSHPTQYFVVNVKDGDAAAIAGTEGERLTGAKWQADGNSVVAVGPRATGEKSDQDSFNSLYSIELATGKTHLLLGEAGTKYGEPTPSPDGKWIAYTSMDGGIFSFEQAAVAIIPIKGGTPKILTANLDRKATDLKWSRDSTAVYFTAADRGCYPLYRVRLAHPGADSLTSNRTWGIRDYDLSAHAVVQIVTNPGNPFELHRATLDGATSTPLTTHNSSWLKGKKLSAYEPHRLETSEGITVDYWTLKPAAFEAGKKYPLLTAIHDGPVQMWGPGEASNWFELQFFAAHGYTVVFCNQRGSAGYGRDFERANFRNWAIGPGRDVLYAAGFAAKESYVDPARQVMIGRGYGGYLVAWIAGHDRRYKAATAINGFYDLPTFFAATTQSQEIARYCAGYPWQENVRSLLDRDSPLNQVENIKTLFLVIQDDRVLPAESGQSQLLFRNLQQLGSEAEYARYPVKSPEAHSAKTSDQSLDELVRTDEFFGRQVGEK
jgi:dipeptidyl aminopeptidase/acylaminoacyl peptidase